MKYKLLTTCLTIFLFGQYTVGQLEIARYYSLFIKPDVVVEIPTFDPICEGQVNGYTTFDKDMKPIKSVVCYTTDNFKRTMLHEIFHNLFRSLDEKRADSYTKDLINIE